MKPKCGFIFLKTNVRLTKYSNKHKKMNETLKISISNKCRNTSIEDIETKGKITILRA